jgi:hypothetical protein
VRHYVLVLLALAIAGCETVPPKPASVALVRDGQRVDAQGEIQSVHQPYAVLVKKLDNGDPSLKDLARHGLPVTVVFANLSSQPVSFGPENITVQGLSDAGQISLLSAEDISEFKRKQESDNNTSSIFDVLFAVVGTAQAGQAMQNGVLSQSQATVIAQGISTMAVTDIADNQAQNQKIEQDEATLIDHYRGVVLEQTSVGPQQQTGGVVFLRNASPDSTLMIRVRTGEYTHQFAYFPPDRVPQLQEQIRQRGIHAEQKPAAAMR